MKMKLKSTITIPVTIKLSNYSQLALEHIDAMDDLAKDHLSDIFEEVLSNFYKLRGSSLDEEARNIFLSVADQMNEMDMQEIEMLKSIELEMFPVFEAFKVSV